MFAASLLCVCMFFNDCEVLLIIDAALTYWLVVTCMPTSALPDRVRQLRGGWNCLK